MEWGLALSLNRCFSILTVQRSYCKEKRGLRDVLKDPKMLVQYRQPILCSEGRTPLSVYNIVGEDL